MPQLRINFNKEFFNTKTITIAPEDKFKEGLLKKESRNRKVWREIYVV